MNNKLLKSKRKNLKSLRTINKNIVVGSIIGTLIAATPYFFSLHESVPEQPIWDTFLFTYDSKVWEDANLVMWIFTGKIIPLLLLIIWFFTCRHWWYHTLIVPIFMYIYQIFGLFNQDSGSMDEFQFLHLLPVMALVIPSIYLIRAQMFNKLNDADKTLEELEEEFKIKPKSIFKKIGDYF